VYTQELAYVLEESVQSTLTSVSSQLHSLEPSFLHSHPAVFNPFQFLVQEEALDDIAMNEAMDTPPPSSNTSVTAMPSKTNFWIN